MSDRVYDYGLGGYNEFEEVQRKPLHVAAFLFATAPPVAEPDPGTYLVALHTQPGEVLDETATYHQRRPHYAGLLGTFPSPATFLKAPKKPTLVPFDEAPVDHQRRPHYAALLGTFPAPATFLKASKEPRKEPSYEESDLTVYHQSRRHYAALLGTVAQTEPDPGTYLSIPKRPQFAPPDHTATYHQRRPHYAGLLEFIPATTPGGFLRAMRGPPPVFPIDPTGYRRPARQYSSLGEAPPPPKRVMVNLDLDGNAIIQPSTTGAEQVLTLSQQDEDESFVDFVGTSAADGSMSLSTDTTEDSAKFGAIRIEINGVTKWLRVYDDES